MALKQLLDGASGAVNIMKRLSVKDAAQKKYGRTDRQLVEIVMQMFESDLK